MADDSIKITTNAGDIASELEAQMDFYQKNLAGTIFDALTILEAEIIQNIRSKSGLHVRSGTLLNSIGASKRVFLEGPNVVGEIGPEGVPYAAIQEFGGTTSPHDIRPRHGAALRFMFGGREVFAKVVHHPGSKIPARPYLRPALAAKKDYILEHFGLFILSSFPPKK